jgi:hypothetical protein
MGLKEAISQRKPPNLRVGNARQRCQLCRHWNGKGMCRKYGYPTRANQLSDSFSPATAPMKGAM